MKFEYAKNPCWVNADQSAIDLVVKWEEFSEEMPFTACPDDIELHGRDLFSKAAAGQFGQVAEFVPPPKPGTIPVTEV